MNENNAIVTLTLLLLLVLWSTRFEYIRITVLNHLQQYRRFANACCCRLLFSILWFQFTKTKSVQTSLKCILL